MKNGPDGLASGDGHVWVKDENGKYREARGRDERLAGLESFVAHCRAKSQERVESVTDPDVVEVLEQDFTLDEMAEMLGRPLTMAEVQYSARSKWNRNYTGK